MTDQVLNEMYFQDQSYALVAVSNLYLFTPGLFGIRACFVNTGCWRGYVAHFALNGRSLVIKDLEFCTIDDEVPVIKGVKAQKLNQEGWFDYCYQDLTHERPFSRN